jgi:hypothetical protein
MIHGTRQPDIEFSASGSRWFQPAVFLGVIPAVLYLAYQIMDIIYLWPRTAEHWVVGVLVVYIILMARRMFPFQIELSITRNVLVARNGLVTKTLNRNRFNVRYIQWGSAMAAKNNISGTIVQISDPDVGVVTIGALNVVLNDDEYDTKKGGDSFQRTDCTFELSERDFYTLVHWLQTGDVDRDIQPNEGSQSALPGEDTDIYLDNPTVYELQPIESMATVVVVLFFAGLVGVSLLGYVFGGPDFSNVSTRLILVTLVCIPAIWLLRRFIRSLLNNKHLSIQFTDGHVVVKDHKRDQVLAQCAVEEIHVHYCMHRARSNNRTVDYDVLELHVPHMATLTIRTSFLFEFEGEQRMLPKFPKYDLAPALATFLVRRLRPTKAKEVVYEEPPKEKAWWLKPSKLAINIIWVLIFVGVMIYVRPFGTNDPTDCAEEEQYSERFGECRTEREMACELSPACTVDGRCSTRGPGHHCVNHPDLCDEVCQNLRPRACALSENCKTKGMCSMQTGTGHCGVMTDQDCGQFEACTTHGRCIARHNTCVLAEKPTP